MLAWYLRLDDTTRALDCRSAIRRQQRHGGRVPRATRAHVSGASGLHPCVPAQPLQPHEPARGVLGPAAVVALHGHGLLRQLAQLSVCHIPAQVRSQQQRQRARRRAEGGDGAGRATLPGDLPQSQAKVLGLDPAAGHAVGPRAGLRGLAQLQKVQGLRQAEERDQQEKMAAADGVPAKPASYLPTFALHAGILAKPLHAGMNICFFSFLRTLPHLKFMTWFS